MAFTSVSSLQMVVVARKEQRDRFQPDGFGHIGCWPLRRAFRVKDFQSNEEFLAVLRMLVERWCDERRLDALARILPGYLAFNGLTDGWGELSNALKATRAL